MTPFELFIALFLAIAIPGLAAFLSQENQE